jgi:hypothetical protein
MGGGGGTTYSTGTQYTSDMPTWVQTPHMELIKWATDAARLRPFPTYEALSEDGMTTYAIPRIAQFDPLQVAAFQGRTDLYERGDPESAMAWGQFGNAGQSLAGMNTSFTPSYSAAQMSAPAISYDYSPGSKVSFNNLSTAYSPSGYNIDDVDMSSAYSSPGAFDFGQVDFDFVGPQDPTLGLGVSDTYGYSAPGSANFGSSLSSGYSLGDIGSFGVASSDYDGPGAMNFLEQYNLSGGYSAPQDIAYDQVANQYSAPGSFDFGTISDPTYTPPGSYDFGSMSDPSYAPPGAYDFGEVGYRYTAPESFDFDAITSSFSPGELSLGDVSSGYQSSAFDFGQMDPSKLYSEASQDFGEFDVAEEDGNIYTKYINPYMAEHEALVEQEKDAATEAFQRTQMQNDAESVAAGSRGSYRQELVNQEAERQYIDQMADIEARSRAQAFSFAQDQYERDRKASITAAQMGDASAQQAAQMRMRAFEQDRESLMRAEQMGDVSALESARMGMQASLSNRDAQAQQFQLQNQFGLSGAQLGLSREQANLQSQMDAARMAEEFGLRGAELDLSTDRAAIETAQSEASLLSQERNLYNQLLADVERGNINAAQSEASLLSQERNLYNQLLADRDRGNIDASRTASQMEQEYGARASEMGMDATRANVASQLQAAQMMGQFGISEAELSQAASLGNIEAIRSAAQMENEFAYRAAQMGLSADEINIESRRSREQLQQQFGLSAEELNLAFEQANMQREMSEFEMLESARQQGAAGDLSARQFAAQNALGARGLYLDTNLQAAQMGLGAGQANREALIEAARMEEQGAQMAGSQALEYMGARGQQQLSQADSEERAQQFLAQLSGDLDAQNIGYDMQAQQIYDQAQQEAALQNMQAMATYSPLALEAQRYSDDAALREEQLGMSAVQMNNEMALQQAQQQIGMGQLASDLGTQYDARQLNRLREMERAGATRRELDQAVLDMNYENYMRRTNWAQDQLNWLQGVLSGAPAAQQTYTTAPGPSPVSELLGLGLAAGSVGNLFGGD